MNRRSFLGSILAAGVAPAFIGSSILMPVRKLVSGAPIHRISLDSTTYVLETVAFRMTGGPTTVVNQVNLIATAEVGIADVVRRFIPGAALADDLAITWMEFPGGESTDFFSLSPGQRHSAVFMA